MKEKRKVMKKKAGIIVINCLILLLVANSFSFGQEKTIELKDKKITLNLENKSLDVIFCYLIQQYDVPIGLEGSTLDNDHEDYLFQTQPLSSRQIDYIITGSGIKRDRTFSINVKDAGLEMVLDQIVRQMKYYKWEINDGVVNIIPVRGRDERYEKLMELKINNYTLEKDMPTGFVKTKIYDLPEVKAFLAENKIHITIGNDISTWNTSRKLPEGMNFLNLSLKDLLNKITKVKRGGWYLRRQLLRPDAPVEYIEIEI